MNTHTHTFAFGNVSWLCSEYPSFLELLEHVPAQHSTMVQWLPHSSASPVKSTPGYWRGCVCLLVGLWIQKDQLKWFGHVVTIPPRRGRHKKPQVGPKKNWRDLLVGWVIGKKNIWISLLKLCPPLNWSRIIDRKWNEKQNDWNDYCL